MLARAEGCSCSDCCLDFVAVWGGWNISWATSAWAAGSSARALYRDGGLSWRRRKARADPACRDRRPSDPRDLVDQPVASGAQVPRHRLGPPLRHPRLDTGGCRGSCRRAFLSGPLLKCASTAHGGRCVDQSRAEPGASVLAEHRRGRRLLRRRRTRATDERDRGRSTTIDSRAVARRASNACSADPVRAARPMTELRFDRSSARVTLINSFRPIDQNASRAFHSLRSPAFSGDR